MDFNTFFRKVMGFLDEDERTELLKELIDDSYLEESIDSILDSIGISPVSKETIAKIGEGFKKALIEGQETYKVVLKNVGVFDTDLIGKVELTLGYRLGTDDFDENILVFPVLKKVSVQGEWVLEED